MAIRNAVTGAFSYTGRYVTDRLLANDEEVITVTNHPNRPDPFGGRVAAVPYAFDDPDALARSLEGVNTLYSTYWVRYSHGATTYDRAVANTGILVSAARSAGVQRIVHVSITGIDQARSLPYFTGKARQEAFIRQSGLSYAIIRPTVIFGLEDILINNIAWFLRRFPVFPMPRGEYRLQPVFVGDMADRMVAAGHIDANSIEDAAGPDTVTFRELVTALRSAVGSTARIVEFPHTAMRLASSAMGRVLRDVVLTPDEIRGLTASLLVSDTASPCPTSFLDWVRANGNALGTRYSSELARHF